MLSSALVAFGVSATLSPVLLVGLRRLDVMDVPSDRSPHVEPTPRGGGIAVGIGAMIGLATVSSLPGGPWIGVVVVACALGLVGLVDDLVEIPVLWRLVAQVAIVAGALPWLVTREGRGPVAIVALACLAGLWIVSYVNAFNFMDGINGISVAQVVVAAGAWAVVAQLDDFPGGATVSLVLAAAALGFAPWNFPRARMFLGDSGSYFMGAWLAGAAFAGIKAGVPPEAMVAPLALNLADTGTTLLRRLWTGCTWHAAHRDHAYQRLVDQGRSHVTVTAIVGFVSVVVSALGLLSLSGSVGLRVVGDLAATIVLIAYLVAPGWLARRRLAGEGTP